MRGVKVASVVPKAVVKFKELEEFTALLKKDYHNDYDVNVMEISITFGRSTGTSIIRS